MIFSMTGFGRAEHEDKAVSLRVEIKSVNHRFFEAAFYMPDGFGIFEERLRERLAARVKRGRIFFYLNYRPKRLEEASIVVNKSLAAKTVKGLKQLGSALGIKDELSVRDIITLPNIIKVVPRHHTRDYLWPKVSFIADKAINDLIQMRRREGAFLARDILSRGHKVNQALRTIEREAPLTIKHFTNRLKTRLKSLDYSREKLVEEVGVFTRNVDISEEVVRLKSHLHNFNKIAANQSVEKGRTLDFIAQEMQREINTIGAKAASINIAKNVVVVKSEIEKIREQLSNVE